MKRYICAVMILSAVITLTGCGGQNEKPEKPTETEAGTSVSTCPAEETEPPSAGPTEATELPTEKQVIDYSLPCPWDCWVYAPWEPGEDAPLMSRINGVPYGSAGYSFRIMDGAIAMVELTALPDAFEIVKDFMAEMTPIQKDYFTFSWAYIFSQAEKRLINFDQEYFEMYASFCKDFDINQYSAEAFYGLDSEVRKMFDEQGITMEWRNYIDMPPFFNAAEIVQPQ